jgi:tRNA (guanine37-N1)-methyltransferase
VLLSPQGERFTQALAHEMSQWPHWVLVCGRYKGIDERVRQLVVTREVSIGDYVLSGGEPAALVVLDAVVRLVPGVLGDEDSAETDSFGPAGDRGLDCTYWTRPAEYRGLRVPEVLLSVHHARIADWRQRESAARTRERRPDLAAPGSGSEASSERTSERARGADESSWRRTG